jgi:hypothetical protein
VLRANSSHLGKTFESSPNHQQVGSDELEKKSRVILSPMFNQPQSPKGSLPPVPPFSLQNDDLTLSDQPTASESGDTGISFPGWLAIDFGTSNSTVTLYDSGLLSSRDGLPKEQEDKLRKELQKWLEPCFGENLARTNPAVNPSDWQAFIQEVDRVLALAGQSSLSDIVAGSTSAELQEALRQIELTLRFSQSEGFQRIVSTQLYELHHEVFREPPLEWQRLIPSVLDLLRKSQEIPSELEVVAAGNPLKVKMGESARLNRRKAFSETGSDHRTAQKRFHHSPKRYLGKEEEVDIVLNGTVSQVDCRRLIQAAWAHLIELTNTHRKDNNNQDKFSQGNFKTAVVTYPAVAPPSVRNQIRVSLQELGITDVRTNYDEAISSAMFFLWRELGSDLRIGIESFKTRCRYDRDHWVQHLLVLDIGGGTTDLALIQLVLKEINPFDPGEDQGLGGRYYVITPKLLGSSGHPHLGGEYITLRIFRVLKAALADCLLTAVSEGSLKSQKLSDLLLQIGERFRQKDDQFRSGTLLAAVDQQKPEAQPAYRDALDAAEKVIPTRWEHDGSRLQAFYTLWDKAEEAKLSLGKASAPALFSWTREYVRDFLNQCGLDDCDPGELDSLCQQLNSAAFALTTERFERAAAPVIRQAVKIADGLINNREQPIDWLILSGKTCGLDLVNREVRQVFSQSRYFLWNPERVTFVSDYAKLSTSIGAGYIEKLRRFVYAPQRAKPFLRQGFNQLYIDVKNLSNFLPSSFKRLVGDHKSELIFEAHTPLYQLDEDASGKARSKWFPTTLAIDIVREDFEGQQTLWGGFNSNLKIAESLSMRDAEFLNQIKVQFEIDHQLYLHLFFCSGDPHYLIEPDLPSIDMRGALSGDLALVNESVDNQLEWDIFIDAEVPATSQVRGGETVLFAAGSPYDQVFRYQTGRSGSNVAQGRGLLSQWISPSPEFEKRGVHVRRRGTKDMYLVGEFPEPRVHTDYPYRYRMTLDDKGILRFHIGEVPYWLSENKAVLRDQPGCVYRAPLDLQPPREQKNRNPFSGIH